MESQTTKIRELSAAFIEELKKQKFPANEFNCIELESASPNGDLQRVKITATCDGWDLYTRFKESWIIK